MKNNLIFTMSLVVIITIAVIINGCAQVPIQPITPDGNNQSIQNGTGTEQNLSVNESTLPVDALVFNSIVDANNQFALDLYARYESTEGNLFFSSYSISSALAMTYEGAKGKTAQEMRAVLHLPEDKTQIRTDYAALYAGLNNPDKPYRLAVANALWAQNDYPFNQDYLSVVEQYYDGKVTNLDFKSDAEGSRKTINSWVEEKTNQKIKDLIPAGALDSLTRLVLTNAIYFKANWSEQFDAEDTRDGKFTLLSGDKKDVNMMHRTGMYAYGETEDAQLLEMPYLGDDLSMLVILPKEGKTAAVENALSTAQLAELKQSMTPEKVAVSMPKFKFETKYFMAKDLQAMGMPTPFSENADFTGMSSAENLSISQVIHQTFVEVAEYGTEAAAATAVIIRASSAGPGEPENIKIFNADHPFIFIIQQRDTGNILFMGRMSNPSNP
ncbi:MAG: serpin family protein [Nanoarchaeota archaeon]